MTRPIFLLLLVALSSAPTATAQFTVDIHLEENLGDSTLGIYLRPTAAFGGVVTGLSFTVRWPMSAGDTLGTRTMTCPNTLVVNGTPVMNNPPYLEKSYQGFGTELLADQGCEWGSCEEVLIMTIPVYAGIAFGPFEIDPASYYIGAGTTGIVYTTEPCLPTGIDDAPGGHGTDLVIRPSLASDELWVAVPAGERPCSFVDIVAADGRCWRTACGPNGHCDIRTLPAGSYAVNASGHLGRFVKL